MDIATLDTAIDVLGPPRWPSPLGLNNESGDLIANYTPDEARILVDPTGEHATTFELAGPRERNHFLGKDVAAGIVTCGGLCPGMNNVIRALVMQLWHAYGVRRVLGFRHGLLGLTPETPDEPMVLTPDGVKRIHRSGGTILGSSRGPRAPTALVDTLQRHELDMLFCIGGDGTMRAAETIYREVERRGASIGVIGVPKTIDNDLRWNERTFGFDTAVSVATDAIRAAYVEATGAPRGVGLVRLMGRHSGFIAASAALASRDANLVLIPELPFDLHGDHGVLAYIRWRIRHRRRCVIVVAEGAGQRHLVCSGDQDPSGNRRLEDIGLFLKDTITRELHDDGITLKYIDPSYIVRAAPANAADSIFCGQLAQDAAHAAMAGKTGMVVGLWLNRFTHVPLRAVTSGRKCVDLDGAFWRATVEATGQPPVFTP